MNNSLDVKDFRRALGQFPTGVTVITTVDSQGEPVGVTASSFNTVSLDPPLILWSVDKGAFSAQIFNTTEYFAVNILSEQQVETSNRFAGRGEDKFAGVSYNKGLGDSPLFEESAAQFECKTWNVVDGGDHLIIIGEVLEYRYNDSLSPLVFARGSYAVTAQHPSAVKREQQSAENSSFLSDYLPYLLYIAHGNSSLELYQRFQQECNVTADEWRVLTLLAENGTSSVSELAKRVMQPEEDFGFTIDWMKDKGEIELPTEDQVSLTEPGKLLVDKLFALAKAHESEVLKKLPPEEVEQLKHSLRTISSV